MKRRLIIGLLFVAFFGVAIWLSVAIPFFMAFRERGEHELNAIYPLEHLRPEYLHNGFGVYILTFNEASDLRDENASELLTLNRLPSKYDLTLIIETPEITDASIDVLSSLRTVDKLLLQGSALSPDGIDRISLDLPAGVLSVRETEAAAEPDDAREPPS